MQTADAYRVYLFAAGARVFLLEFLFSISGVYQIVVVGMTPFQLVLAGTVLSITVFVFEIPTGIVADVYSRRLSVIIGILVAGAGALVVGLSPTLGAVLFGNFLWGLSETFISGAFTAWFVDEVGQARAEPGMLRRVQVEQVAMIAGLFAGALLGSFVIALPLLLGGAGLLLLGGLLALIMPETGFAPLPKGERSTWGNVWATFQGGLQVVRGHRVLTALTLLFLVWGAATEGFYRLWEKHLIDNFTLPPLPVPQPAVIWFSLLAFCAGLLTMGASELVRRQIIGLRDRGMAGLLFGVTVLLLAALVGFALAPELTVAVGAYLAAYGLGGLVMPIVEAWTNRHIDSRVRATVLSMYGQVEAVGRVGGGPLVGGVGNRSMRLAMLLSAALLVPALLVYARAAARAAK